MILEQQDELARSATNTHAGTESDMDEHLSVCCYRGGTAGWSPGRIRQESDFAAGLAARTACILRKCLSRSRVAAKYSKSRHLLA